MAVLGARKRKALSDSDFAYPERRKLPITDAGHVRAAVGRFARTQFDSTAAMKRAAAAILRAAKRHGVEIGESTYVARAARGGLSGQRKTTGAAAPRKRRNPGTTANSELARARQMSEQFHGSDSQVIELSEKERKLGRYAIALGQIPELSYEPEKGSKREGYRFVHESGDRGPLRSKSKKRPVLAVDVATGRPIIVPMGSGMTMDSRRGLIG